ncbi:MAG: EI24 domain-containing protein [Polymorphobacter sp.]
MIAALILSFAQLGDRALLRVLLRSLALTLLIFGLVGWGIFTGVGMIETNGWPAWLKSLWTGGGGGAAAFVLTMLLSWLSFAGIATGVTGLWLDEIIGAVEWRYYPQAQAKPVGLAREIRMGLAAGTRVLLWNALFLPAYLLLLFTAIGPLLLFLAVNAWLLGREYLETVAVRHLPGDAAAAWPQTWRWDRWGTGIVTAGLFALPFVNLLAPIIGAAFATHMFHRRTP